MAKFRIQRFLKRDIVVRINYTNGNVAVSQRKLFEFYPSGKTEDEGWYETTDQVLIDSLKEQTETLPYSPQNEEGLKRAGIAYEYAYCAACGNKRVRKLEYHLFEVIDDERIEDIF